MNWYLKVLALYTEFSGRARRREFWMFNLFNTLFAITLLLIDNALGISLYYVGNNLGAGYLYSLYVLLVFIPSLALSVRRLHDISKSGWMLLIGFIPLVGAIWLIVLFLKDSSTGKNKYGANPKGL